MLLQIAPPSSMLLKVFFATVALIGAAENGLAQVPSSTAPLMSQTRYLQCQPPNSGEYLLLIVNKAEAQSKISQVLPSNATATVCTYYGEVVTRVSGFSSLETANSWAQYLTETVGLQTFVARPAQAETASRPELSRTQPSTASYNPQMLGAGYAVLVNYFDRPEVAAQVQQVLNQPVGLASYRQRPYLLAIQTIDQATANSMLRRLSDRGFQAMVVNSQRVTLLKSMVSVSAPAIGER